MIIACCICSQLLTRKLEDGHQTLQQETPRTVTLLHATMWNMCRERHANANKQKKVTSEVIVENNRGGPQSKTFKFLEDKWASSGVCLTSGHRIPDFFVTVVGWQQALIPDRHTVAEQETRAEQLSSVLPYDINMPRKKGGNVWKELWIRLMETVV